MNITPFTQEINQTKEFTFNAAGQEVVVSSIINEAISAYAIGYLSDHISLAYKTILSDIKEESSLPEGKTLFFFPLGEKPIIFCNNQCPPGLISYVRNSEYIRVTPIISENVSLQISDNLIEKYYLNDIDIYKNHLKKDIGMTFFDQDKLKEFKIKLLFFIRNKLIKNDNKQALIDFNDYTFRLFIDSILEEQKKSLRINNKHRIIRKAIDIINDNPFHNYTVTQLAEDTNISTRSLQIAFKQTLDISPKKYLTNVRLTQIRSELTHQRNKTIQEICAKYGIVHFGNFPREYKKLFGEEPSKTKDR